MCGSLVDIQYMTAEIRRGKKIARRRRNHRKEIQCPHLLCRAAIKMRAIWKQYVRGIVATVMLEDWFVSCDELLSIKLWNQHFAHIA